MAEKHSKVYPLACNIIKTYFYVDDLLTGSDFKEEILCLQCDINKILVSAGFQLRKWLSNDISLCNKFIINENLESSVLMLGDDDVTKTLGIL